MMDSLQDFVAAPGFVFQQGKQVDRSKVLQDDAYPRVGN